MPFKRFGKRLADRIHLYGFLFCWDLTEDGVKVGYPLDFYPATADFLTGVITGLKLFLKMPSQTCIRCRPLYKIGSSPLGSARSIIPLKLRPWPSGPLLPGTSAWRPVVLWAWSTRSGKSCFDVVQAIAARLPQVDFPLLGRPGARWSSWICSHWLPPMSPCSRRSDPLA